MVEEGAVEGKLCVLSGFQDLEAGKQDFGRVYHIC